MFKRRLAKILEMLYEKEKNTVITGSRQVGKSTLLEKILPSSINKGFYYINFDDPDMRLEFSKNALDKLRPVIEKNLVFDEVQKFPRILEIVKMVIDSDATRHCFLTGSFWLLLMKKVQESLAGRVGLWNMYPLAFSEFFDGRIDLNLDEILDMRSSPGAVTAGDPRKNAQLRYKIREHQKWGGYPALYSISEPELRFRWLDNYRKTYLEKDVRDLSPGIDVTNITRFMNLLFLRSGQLLSYSDLARDCGISVATARNYTRSLEIGYLVFLLQPYFENETKRLVKSPKIYALDTGLAGVVTRQIEAHEITGAVYETWVLTELVKWASAKLVPPELFFYRTASGLEIDFLLKYKGGSLLAIVAKNRESAAKSDATPIKRFMETHEACGIGLVVYRGDEVMELSPGIWAIPDYVLFL